MIAYTYVITHSRNIKVGRSMTINRYNVNSYNIVAYNTSDPWCAPNLYENSTT